MQIRTIAEAQAYLEEHIRMDVFTRYDADKHLKTPLERIAYFLALLGNPQTKFSSVQVTGTSGKGSTSYLLSHILATARYKTGFTLSPHLQHPHERLQINNQQASNEEFIATLNKLIPAIEQMTREPIGKPSYFEILMAMAFQYFADKDVEIAVAEVGLEGKYDATNVLEPIVVIFTNISLDHTAILGDTVEKIAQEAVSAIKQQATPATVITGGLQSSIDTIVREKSKEVGAQLISYQEKFMTEITEMSLERTVFDFKEGDLTLSDIELPLKGAYQVENAALAIAAALALREKGYHISDTHIREALRSAFFPGRFEIFKYQGRTIILDGAHNDAKMESFIQALSYYYPIEKKAFIVGFKRDKNIVGMMDKLLTVADALVITQFQKTTDQSKNFSMDPQEIVQLCQLEERNPQVFSDSLEALEQTIHSTDEASLVIVTGSLYLVGEVREYLTSQS